MSVSKYADGVGHVRRELSGYSHESIFRCALSYLSVRSKGNLEEARKMPWVVMFLLKMALLEKSGRNEISDHVFIRLANKVFHLQGQAANFKGGNAWLSLRAMMLGQLFYQKDSATNLRELVMQATFYSGDDRYYENIFFEAFGLTLENYIAITLVISVRLESNAGLGVLKMPITELMHLICPKIPYAHLLAYLRLTSCKLSDLPEFMAGYDLGDIHVSEYFQETPFKYVPFILEGNGLVALNYSFCITALCSMVPVILKKKYPKFKDKFGKDMEARVGSVLAGLPGCELINEAELAEILKFTSHDGKLVDYVFREGDSITLVESKAIEPSDLVKCTADPAVLRRSLAPSYIYAIHQGQQVAAALKKIERYKGCKFRILVVTHEDHYVFGGRYISDNIDPDLFLGFENKFGEIPVISDRVSYVSLQSFTSLVHCLKENNRSLGEFLDKACDDQHHPETKRITMAHSIENEFQGTKGAWIAGLEEQLDLTHARVEEVISSNAGYWRGKPEKFLAMYTALLNDLHATSHASPL